MFVFMEFYQGGNTSAVENIDHDRVVELTFGCLSKMADDSDWSFSVGRLKD